MNNHNSQNGMYHCLVSFPDFLGVLYRECHNTYHNCISSLLSDSLDCYTVWLTKAREDCSHLGQLRTSCGITYFTDSQFIKENCLHHSHNNHAFCTLIQAL